MKLSERCYAVTGLGYLTPWCVNAGFIVGDEITLVVDTGANLLAAQSLHGYACAARPSNRLQVINTEKHFDHIGGNGLFRGLGIDVWGRAERTSDEFRAEIEEFNEAIPSPIRRARGEARAFFCGTELVNPNRRVQEEMTFELGNCPVEVRLTPGHTATNLSVWVPQDKVVYTGDCVVQEYLPNLDAGDKADWEQWLKSLDLVESLRPRTVVPGHGPVASGEEVERALDSMREVLGESIARGTSPTAVSARAS